MFGEFWGINIHIKYIKESKSPSLIVCSLRFVRSNKDEAFPTGFEIKSNSYLHLL
jgi:hypothetical protein